MKRLLLFLSLTATAFAHVGSPDVFYEGNAGPYHLLVTVRPPAMIPGVAEVEVRTISGTVTGIHIVPVYVTLKDQGFPPTPDVMQVVPGDPQSFTGKVWLMASGSWEVRADVEGPQGAGKLAVPVPAFARRTLPMQKTLGVLLFGLMLFLVLGVVAIAGAAAGEGSVNPGTAPGTKSIRRGRIAMLVATVMALGILFLGNWWWNSEASTQKYDMLYKAPPLAVSLENGGHLVLRMGASHWHDRRKQSWSMQLIPDHGHLMHLFLLRVPAMDRFYHLHPEQAQDGAFALDLPAIDAGHYKLFADVVRETGFPDTMVAEMDLPQIAGRPLAGDDSEVSAAAFTAGSDRISPLADGGRMVWEPDTSVPAIGKLSWFRFHVEDKDGKPVSDLEPYMGMAGHAVFVRSDESVFAHIHPAGSAPMAALAIAQKDAGGGMDMAGHSMAMPAEVSFPYGFPQAGDYRLFVQVKRSGQVETGVFDTKVTN
jgi:hypothetical protein